MKFIATNLYRNEDILMVCKLACLINYNDKVNRLNDTWEFILGVLKFDRSTANTI